MIDILSGHLDCDNINRMMQVQLVVPEREIFLPNQK